MYRSWSWSDEHRKPLECIKRTRSLVFYRTNRVKTEANGVLILKRWAQMVCSPWSDEHRKPLECMKKTRSLVLHRTNIVKTEANCGLVLKRWAQKPEAMSTVLSNATMFVILDEVLVNCDPSWFKNKWTFFKVWMYAMYLSNHLDGCFNWRILKASEFNKCSTSVQHCVPDNEICAKGVKCQVRLSPSVSEAK